MDGVPHDFRFLDNPDLDSETKKQLLAGILDQKRYERDLVLTRSIDEKRHVHELALKEKEAQLAQQSEEKRHRWKLDETVAVQTLEDNRHGRERAEKAKELAAAQALERRRFWHNTPLMLALVGTITVFANGLVAYIQGMRAASDKVTLTELEAKLKQSEQRSQSDREQQLQQLRQQLSLQSAEADARRAANKDEREFAFKIIERELAKSSDETSRAEVLLFLVRAGILNSLDRIELEKMAVAQFRRSGKVLAEVGIPPTLGRTGPPLANIETVPLDYVVAFATRSDPFPYTQIYLAGWPDLSDLAIKEPAEFLLSRLPRAAAFTRLNARENFPVWIKTNAISIIRTNDVISATGISGNALIEFEGRMQAVQEDVTSVVAQVSAVGTYIKFTSVSDGQIWVKPTAVTQVSENVPGTSMSWLEGVHAILHVEGSRASRVGVKEEAGSARAILTGAGAMLEPK